MDDEQVIAAAQASACAAVDLLNLIAADQGTAQPELDDLALKLAEALAAVLDWMPDRDQDDNQLAGALTRWLP